MFDLNSFDKNNYTKEFVLQSIGEEWVFNNYGIPVQKGHFSNPLRKDNKGTCYFYRNSSSNRLYFYDPACNYHWDCFNLVQFLYNCDFFNAVKKIVDSFKEKKKITIDTDKTDAKLKIVENELITKKEKTIIKYAPKKFTEEDLIYWKSFGISEKTLNFYNVKAVEALFVDRKKVYSYRRINPCYAYNFFYEGSLKNKIYFPLSKTNKWISNTNSNILQGYLQLPNYGNNLIITKSLKDVMSLRELGFFSIAPQSENIFPKNIEELKNRFKNVILLFDNDEAGKKSSELFSKNYKIPYYLIPDSYGTKDVSDMIKTHSQSEALIFLNSII